jgi:hypothetical protein
MPTDKRSKPATAVSARNAGSAEPSPVGTLKGTNRKSTTTPAKVRRQQSDFLAGCSMDERVYCVRLISLLRDDYWMAELVRQILDEEARATRRWTIRSLRELLDNFDTIEALADNAQRFGLNWSNHPILRAIRKEWQEDEIGNYVGERGIRRLIESAHKK